MVDDGYGPKDMSDMEKTKNRIQYVLFEPGYVGWDVGLTKAVLEADKMHVPLAVKTSDDFKEVKKRFPVVNIVIVGE